MPRRGENIYKRKDGRYEGRFIREYDETGKARYGAVYAKTYAQTKAKLSVAKEAVRHGPAPQKAGPSVAAWFGEYLKTIRPGVKTTTYGVYGRYVKNHIIPGLGQLDLAGLTVQRLQGFAEALTEKGLSPRTLRAVFQFLGEGLREAEESGYAVPPRRKVRLPRVIDKQMRVFSLEEQKQLEKAAVCSGGNRIGIHLCLYTGLRLGELCGLMWKDIDFQTGTLYVKRTLQRIANEQGEKKTKLAFLPPKSEASRRAIPLPAFVLEMLDKAYKHCCGSAYVISKDGKPVDPRTYQYQFQKLLKECDVAHANFHALRHTFATRALEIGFDVKTLSEILGHRSAAVTLNKYAHSLDEHKRSRMELLSGIYQLG